MPITCLKRIISYVIFLYLSFGAISQPYIPLVLPPTGPEFSSWRPPGVAEHWPSEYPKVPRCTDGQKLSTLFDHVK